MSNQKDEEEILYIVKPIELKTPVKGLFQLWLGTYPVECPFMTVHGIYQGSDMPQGFAKQPCTTACPHASLSKGDDGKGFWEITCSGQASRRLVQMRENSKIAIVPAIINP